MKKNNNKTVKTDLQSSNEIEKSIALTQRL